MGPFMSSNKATGGGRGQEERNREGGEEGGRRGGIVGTEQAAEGRRGSKVEESVAWGRGGASTPALPGSSHGGPPPQHATPLQQP